MSEHSTVPSLRALAAEPNTKLFPTNFGRGFDEESDEWLIAEIAVLDEVAEATKLVPQLREIESTVKQRRLHASVELERRERRASMTFDDWRGQLAGTIHYLETVAPNPHDFALRPILAYLDSNEDEIREALGESDER